MKSTEVKSIESKERRKRRAQKVKSTEVVKKLVYCFEILSNYEIFGVFVSETDEKSFDGSQSVSDVEKEEKDPDVGDSDQVAQS